MISLNKTKIIVLGARGQVGQCVLDAFRQENHFEVYAVDRSILDVEDELALDHFFELPFDVVINCTAYTAVDLAETNAEKANVLNHLVPKKLASICDSKQKLLVHYSTDYVYDNGSTTPLIEESPCNPKSVYAQTKWMGEQAILAKAKRALILRTSWVYSVYGTNFVKTIRRLALEKEEINVVDDQIGNPTYAPDLASATIDMLHQVLLNGNEHYGVYNYSNTGGISWYEFAKAILTKSGFNTRVCPVPTTSFPRPAPRPAYSVLSLDKINRHFGIEPNDWALSLDKCLRILSKA